MGPHLLFLLVLSASSTLAVKLLQKSCAPGPGVPAVQTLTISSIDVDGCENEPCVFYQGQIYSIKFTMVADFDWKPTSTLNLLTIAHTPLGKITLIDDNMCKRYSKSLNCTEIKRGKAQFIMDKELIYEVYPQYAGDCRIIIKYNSEPVFCTDVTVVIKAKPVTVDAIKNRVKAQKDMREENKEKLKTKVSRK